MRPGIYHGGRDPGWRGSPSHFLAHNRGAGPKVSALHTEGAADQTLLAAAIELARADSRSWCAGAKARRLGWIPARPLSRDPSQPSGFGAGPRSRPGTARRTLGE